MMLTLINCVWSPGVSACKSFWNLATSIGVFAGVSVVLVPGNSNCPDVVYGSGTCNGTIELEKGTGAPGSAVITGWTVNGKPPVAKLSCHKLGSNVVIAPPACSTECFVKA